MSIKSIIFGLIILISALGVSMSMFKMDVPKAVEDAFSQKYPTAKKVKWELEKKGEYEAEFKFNKKEMSANFKENGSWVGTETKVGKDDLPQTVRNGIAAKFPGYEIEEAELSEKPEGIIEYEVELENKKGDVELKAVFSVDGKFIKKKMEIDDDEVEVQENDNDDDE